MRHTVSMSWHLPVPSCYTVGWSPYFVPMTLHDCSCVSNQRQYEGLFNSLFSLLTNDITALYQWPSMSVIRWFPFPHLYRGKRPHAMAPSCCPRYLTLIKAWLNEQDHHMSNTMFYLRWLLTTLYTGLLPDTQNCGLHMHREYREHFPRHRGLAIPTCITARAWLTCCVACRDRKLAVSFDVGGWENIPDIPGACPTRNFAYLVRGPWPHPYHCDDVYLQCQQLLQELGK